MDLGPLSAGPWLFGLVTICSAAWINFDTWEDRPDYDVFSHYLEVDYNYRNPLFINCSRKNDILPSTTPTMYPKFFKRNYLKIKKALNKTMEKYQVRERFDRFDKYRIIRGVVRRIQKILYLNVPEERVPWFPPDPNSEGHLEACTYSEERPMGHH